MFDICLHRTSTCGLARPLAVTCPILRLSTYMYVKLYATPLMRKCEDTAMSPCTGRTHGGPSPSHLGFMMTGE